MAREVKLLIAEVVDADEWQSDQANSQSNSKNRQNDAETQPQREEPHKRNPPPGESESTQLEDQHGESSRSEDRENVLDGGSGVTHRFIISPFRCLARITSQVDCRPGSLWWLLLPAHTKILASHTGCV